MRQNLFLGQKSAKKTGRWAMADMFKIFPRLEERVDTPAGVLSGGEQQMLTMCRTLMGDPDLIMIDEPTEGLAPMMVELVGKLLSEIAGRGISILLVEQKLTIALKISHRLYVMGHGEIVFSGTPGRPRRQRRHPQGMAGSLTTRLARVRRQREPHMSLSAAEVCSGRQPERL